MKILAGGQLWHRNPSSDPAKTNNTPATNQRGSDSDVSMIAAKISDAIRAMPDDNPSMLSRKLNELISTINHKTLITNSSHGTPRNAVACTPAATNADATQNWITNRGFHGRSTKSSINPMIDNTVPPASTAHICPDR